MAVEIFHDQISTKEFAGRMVDLEPDCNKKLFTNSLLTVHDFGKMQNTSPAGLLGEESNIDVI